MRVLLQTGIVFLLSSCGDDPTPEPTFNNSTQLSTPSATPIAEEPLWEDMVPQDLAEVWHTFDDDCNGTSKPNPKSCTYMAGVERILASKNWCMETIASGARTFWAECSNRRPLPAVTLDEILYEEERERTPLLMAYESQIKDLARQNGMAKSLVECGIRTSQWYEEFTVGLKKRMEDPSLLDMRFRLSSGDSDAAKAYYDNNVALPVHLYATATLEKTKEDVCRESTKTLMVQGPK